MRWDVRPVPASWKRHLLDRGRPRSCSRGEAELLFFDPTGHGCARDAKRAAEATQAASFLVGVQNLLAASLWIGIGSRVLAAATPAGVTAILLLAVGGMPIAHECIASTVGTVKGDRHHLYGLPSSSPRYPCHIVA